MIRKSGSTLALFVAGFSFVSLSIGSEIESGDPPFEGTIFVDPDIITSNDPSSFSVLVFKGRAVRNMFDRRIDAFEEFHAFVFVACYDDGLAIEFQVNPEFGTEVAAAEVVNFYAPIFGRLPRALRTDIKTSWIHKGDQPFGGGNENLLIHTGIYEDDYIDKGILEETLVHEAAHSSFDRKYANAEEWTNAQASDANFISTYARNFPVREDLAESFLLYLAVRHRQDRVSNAVVEAVRTTIPARLSFFDSLILPMYPLAVDARRSRTAPAADAVEECGSVSEF
ncbi:MAG: hypothetical protein AAF351_15785 [Pseudomonadota bacterium]